MSMIRNTVMMVLAVGLLASCIKDELPVPRADRGGARDVQVCVGPDYGDQVWYDIGTNTIAARNSRMDWCLAFAGAADGWDIRLNGARFMHAKATGQTDITLPTDTTGYGPHWRVDHNEGAVDSTAIGDWRNSDEVYVIDLGVNAFGASLGFRKLKVFSYDAASYVIQTAMLNGTNVQQYTVQKDPTRKYVHFSLRSGQQVDIAPPDGSYDLVFTQYTYQFYDPYMAYMVTGAVNGFSGLRVAELTTDDFLSVTLDDTLAHPFSTAEDAIGYDWKEYSFETSSYVIYPEKVFIVQDREGFFFKLHFIDFYNENGQRGCPRFEVVEL